VAEGLVVAVDLLDDLLRAADQRRTALDVVLQRREHRIGAQPHRLRHWHDVPLRDLATARLGVPVLVDKDVTAGVVAEAWRRGGGFRDAALIMVESGIGAGLWLGGAAHRGAHTNAGEFGHTVIVLDGPPCVCGRRGCLEAVHDRAREAGDVATAARVLATGVVNLAQTVDLRHVVLAGTDLIAHAHTYLDAARHAVAAEVPRADWVSVEVSLSGLGADVIAAGAAMEMLDATYGVPAPSAAWRGSSRRSRSASQASAIG